MKYGVIGTGAIGGYYGAKLAHAGQEVHFLFHSDYDLLCQDRARKSQSPMLWQLNLANYSCKDEALMQTVVEEFRQAGIETGLVEYHEAGCPMPKLEMLEAELRFLEENRNG